MTREFIEQLDVIEPYCYETDREEIWYKVGLVNGLKIADENPNLESLWYDTSEIPELKDSILIQFARGRCDVYTIHIKAQTDLWHSWCKEYEVSRWAYVKDLLPKGGEKNDTKNIL